MFGNCHGSHAISLISLWIINFYIRFTLRAMEISYETILLRILTFIITSPYQFGVAVPTIHFLNTPIFVKMYSDNAVQKIISSPKLFISRRGHPIDLIDLYY